MRISISKRDNIDRLHIQAIMESGRELRGDLYDEVLPGQHLLGVPYERLLEHVGETVDLEDLQEQA